MEKLVLSRTIACLLLLSIWVDIVQYFSLETDPKSPLLFSATATTAAAKSKRERHLLFPVTDVIFPVNLKCPFFPS